MTVAQIQRIINNLDHEYMIETIITETREGINQISDAVEWDYSNELVKIKKFDYSIASGAFNATADGDTLTVSNVLGIERFKYRQPKIGDMIFLINKTTGVITTTNRTIVSIVGNKIILDGSLSISNQYIGYTGLDSLNGLTPIPMQQYTLIKKTPISSFDYDVYIDMSKIVAINTVNMQMSIAGY